MPINPNNINTTTRDLLSRARDGSGTRRLTQDLSMRKQVCDYSVLAHIIRTEPGDQVFVPDTCFFTAHEIPDEFWDALMTKRVAVTTEVYSELEPWRRSPRCNAKMVTPIASKENSDGPPIVPADGPHWGRYWTLARQYYSTLLSSRKDRALKLVDDFRAENGRDPTREELQQLLQNNGTDRDFRLMRKAIESGAGPNWWTDELLVTAALQIGVYSGTPTSILTRDHDVFDQFERLCSLVTMDYQAYLFGECFRTYSDRFRCVPMPDDPVVNAYFDASESFLVSKPVPADEFTGWLFPSRYRPATISCALFAGPPGETTVEVLTFNAEQEISHMMRVKGRTLGRSSDLPDGLNCHVTGFPETIPSPREFVIIGKDRWITGPGTEMRWSQLDYAHANFEDGIYIRAE